MNAPSEAVRALLIDTDPLDDPTRLPSQADAWMPVDLPFDVHRALLDAGRIRDPDFSDWNAACDWVQHRDWWVLIRLPAVDAPADARRLVCDGLHGLAKLWLDGEVLGEHRNAFRPAVFEVGSHEASQPELLVRLRPAAVAFPHDSEPQVHVRQPAYAFGWDFAPPRPQLGIRSVCLRTHRGAVLHDVAWTIVELSEAAATVAVTVATERLPAADVEAQISLSDADGAVVATALSRDDAQVRLRVSQPQLWWTHDLGEPYLYRLDVEVRSDGLLVDRTTRRIGLRTVELDTTPDGDGGGSAFQFVLNGTRIFVKGANWVPPSMSCAPDPERTRALTQAARDANMNMLRVWGGGSYASPDFYDACDELGLLVWQDFMFACQRYQDDAAWVAEVEAEARYQVRRLRSHASVALWCGNNEVEMLAELFDWTPSPAHAVFLEILPRIVAEESQAPYIPSSPSRGNSPLNGDRHNWHVWHGIDHHGAREGPAWSDPHHVEPGSEEALAFARSAHPRNYLVDRARFTSEFGVAAFPTWPTLKRWHDPEELRVDSREVLARVRPGRIGPTNKLELLMSETTGLGDDLTERVQLSHQFQTAALKMGVEHFRRNRSSCGGALIWQLNDCWPSVSWSLIDVDLRPKPAYFAARELFAPVLASLHINRDELELWVCNDTNQQVEDTLTVAIFADAGVESWSASLTATAAPQQSLCLARWQLAKLGPIDAGAYAHVYGRTTPANRLALGDL